MNIGVFGEKKIWFQGFHILFNDNKFVLFIKKDSSSLAYTQKNKDAHFLDVRCKKCQILVADSRKKRHHVQLNKLDALINDNVPF